MALLACGCATVEKYSAPSDGAITYPRKMVLVQVPMRIDKETLHRLFAPNLPQDSPESRQAIANAADVAQARALADMRNALEKQLDVRFDDGDAGARLADHLQIRNGDAVISKDVIERMRAATNADALLWFRVTDYGVTPRSWRNAVIAFEVTSTLGIAAVAYAYPATRALAGVYLVEEGAEESAEYYAGFGALNEVCRPVRIEAGLISLNSGTQVWENSTTGFSDVRLSRLVRTVSTGERDGQLSSAMDEASTNIVTDLRKVLPEHDAARGRDGGSVRDF